MGFVPPKAYVLIQLSVLLLSCFNVFGDELDIVSLAQSPHHYFPAYPPADAPIYDRDQPPSHDDHHHHKGHPPSYHHKGHPPSQPPKSSPTHPPSHHHKGHPPSQPPVHPPKSSPTHPPSHHHKGHPPSQPPVHPPKSSPTHPPSYRPVRKLVAVQGVVFCKSCKYTGFDNLSGASPLLGAVVRLQCNNTKYPIVQEAKTDKNGYFFIEPSKKVTTFGAHKCKVFIVSSPLVTCNKPTNLHDGLKGAILMRQKLPPVPPQHQLPFELFSVGPFAFESSAKIKCPP